MKLLALFASICITASLTACSNTWTGVGKDLQEMGKKMDPQAKPAQTAPAGSTSAPASNSNKDVTVTPVK